MLQQKQSQTNIAKSNSQSSHGTKKSSHTKQSASLKSGTSKSSQQISEAPLNLSNTTDPEYHTAIEDSSKTTLEEDLIGETTLEIAEEEPRTILDIIGPPKRESLSEFHKRNLTNDDLFPTVVTLGSNDKLVNVKKEVPSILVTGFGMRNLKSLQDALSEENKRLLEIYERQQRSEPNVFMKTCTSKSSTSTKSSKSRSTKASSETLTDKTDVIGDKFNLQYLMGLQQQEEEEQEDELTEVEQQVDVEKRESFVYSSSISMKKAQHYLRVHRIFDFFQFIIAQLLGAAPENPIYFILELLNKCLLYRSGAGPPPLLYETRHIAQLFNLMDIMNTGFIDMEQYIQAMVTFGICEYNKDPIRTEEGISSKTFIEEVYEAELNLFDDLIRRKYIDKKDRKYTDRPIDYAIKTQESKTSYFMPSDLFKSLKPLSQIQEDTEAQREG